MGQGAVAQVILAPAMGDLVLVGRDTLRVPCPFGFVVRERFAFLFEPISLGLELVKLAARARLSPVEATDVEEEGPPYLPPGRLVCRLLVACGIGGVMDRDGGGRDQGMDAPIHP